MHRLAMLAVAAVCVSLATTARAQVIATWIGGPHNWTEPNWIINGAPATIPNGPQVTARITLGAPILDTGMFFNVGNVVLTGTGNLSGLGELTISDGLLHDSGTLGANIVLTGPGSSWTGGSWASSTNGSTTVSSTGALQIDVSGNANIARRTFTNDGTVTHRSGDLSGTLANQAGGVAASSVVNNGSWIDSTLSAMEYTAPPTHLWIFTNNAIYTKLGSGTATFAKAKLDNTGTVDVQEGALNLNQGGISGSTALFHAEPGAAINFSSAGPAYAVNGSTFTGAGQFTATGRIDMNGTITASNLTIDDTIFAGTHTLAGPNFLWTGNDVVSVGGNGATTLSAGSLLEIDVVGLVNLTRRTLTNDGTVTHRSGDLSGTLANQAGGVAASSVVNNGAWIDSTVSAMEYTAPPTHLWIFTNNAIYTKLGSGTATFAKAKLDNTGTVDVQEGALNLNQGGTSGSTALFHAEPGAAINFSSAGPAYAVNGSTFTGDGQFTATGRIDMNGTITASNLTIDDTIFAGTHTLTGPNFLWTGNDVVSVGGNGATTLSAGSLLEIDVVNLVNLTRRTLTNDGTITHRSGNPSGSAGRPARGIAASEIINNGTWTVTGVNAVEFVTAGSGWFFTNNGTFTKQGPSSTTFRNSLVNAGVVDVQSGLLNMVTPFRQTAGEMILSGGDVAGTLTFTGGSLRGSGNLAGNVTMTGATLDPGMSAGLLDFGANLTLNGAAVPIELQGTSRGTTYDAMDVAGSLSLGGSALQLDVTLLDPATPIGTEFLIFDKVSALAIGGTLAGLPEGALITNGIFEFEITYLGGDGNDVVLTVTNSGFCYADCDPSTGVGVLDLFDFLCFQGSFVNSEPYACDCDTTTGPLVCDLFDFLCFQGAFVSGCP